jgi:hypothetical protein
MTQGMAWPARARAAGPAARLLAAGGIGGGAIAIPLFGMAGGYALSGRGPLWSRIVLGLVALAPVPAWAFASASFGPGFSLAAPRGAWLPARPGGRRPRCDSPRHNAWSAHVRGSPGEWPHG